ncbi:hypothetical protein [Prescottella agglutinans]|uniref:Replication protein n=1 Tax=Prescottella agglutinans TaxID=1644129 RepID=A0ABT6MGU7_9NOCA|nr:hypothetical protein [Prescottella agglutinans]MDH6283548.1 hypothetical protein [Prescottella agglutinans]
MADVFIQFTKDRVKHLGSGNAAIVWARIEFACRIEGPDRFEDEHGRWWEIPVSRLAEETGLSVQSVRTALDAMAASGDVEVSMRDRASMKRAKAYRAVDRISAGTGHLLLATNAPVAGNKCACEKQQAGLLLPTNVPYIEEAKKSSSVEIDREDVMQLCETLRDCMVANGCRTPIIGKAWKTAARLLLDADGRTLTEALAVLKWSQQDSFWRANIQSMPKFRKQYDQLRLRMEDAGVRPPATAGSVEDWLRTCWQEHNTKDVADRSGMTFQPPDPTGDVHDLRAFNLQARRTWIKNNSDEIIRRVLLKEEKRTV